MKPIYLDHNATTRVDSQVWEAMRGVLCGPPANPSSLHGYGREAKKLLMSSREEVASSIGARPSEIIFTSGGTEAIHLAILGSKPKGRILTTKIEHAALFLLIEQLEIGGLPVTYLPVSKKGHVEAEEVRRAITGDTCLIALGAVNSETGVKNPIEEIASIAKESKIPFFVDGVALLGKEHFSIPDGVTTMAFSGHKIYGPTGTGFLFCRKNSQLTPLFFGGGQESLRRSGTENLAGIVGLAKAAKEIHSYLPTAQPRMKELRDYLERSLLSLFPSAYVNGSGPRVCNTSSITFLGMDGESMLIQLDLAGVYASMGSACSSGSIEPSRTLLEMGLSRGDARSTLRFSLGKETTFEEIERTIQVFQTI